MARRRRRIDPEVYQEIHRMVREGVYTSAAQVHRALEKRFGTETPSVRTVQDIVRELDPPDPSGPWTPGPENDPEDDARVLGVMGELFPHPGEVAIEPAEFLVRHDFKEEARVKEALQRAEQARHEIRWNPPSRDHAKWIAWLRGGWPDLPGTATWILAAEYRARRAREKDTSDCDAFLAFAPWRSGRAYLRYIDMVRDGRIPGAPYLRAMADLMLLRTWEKGADPELDPSRLLSALEEVGRAPYRERHGTEQKEAKQLAKGKTRTR